MNKLLSSLGAVLLAGVLAGTLFGASPAQAQGGGGIMKGTNDQGLLTGPMVAPNETARGGNNTPKGLPGARRDDGSGPMAYAKPPSEMGPNEALFDAINRGDTPAARDAINRGADLGARNVLGLTPTDLAIDLGRNDITFLLLAQRGADRNVFDTQVEPSPAPKGHAAKAAPAPATARTTRTARTAPATPMREATAAPITPRYSNTPDTPAPQDGFLGFGPSR